jgi:hypothetical protein
LGWPRAAAFHRRVRGCRAAAAGCCCECGAQTRIGCGSCRSVGRDRSACEHEGREEGEARLTWYRMLRLSTLSSGVAVAERALATTGRRPGAEGRVRGAAKRTGCVKGCRGCSGGPGARRERPHKAGKSFCPWWRRVAQRPAAGASRVWRACAMAVHKTIRPTWMGACAVSQLLIPHHQAAQRPQHVGRLHRPPPRGHHNPRQPQRQGPAAARRRGQGGKGGRAARAVRDVADGLSTRDQFVCRADVGCFFGGACMVVPSPRFMPEVVPSASTRAGRARGNANH